MALDFIKGWGLRIRFAIFARIFLQNVEPMKRTDNAIPIRLRANIELCESDKTPSGCLPSGATVQIRRENVSCAGEMPSFSDRRRRDGSRSILNERQLSGNGSVI